MSNMPLRKGTATKYHKLSKEDHGFLDSQFKKPPPKIPYKAILLAAVLFIGGTLLLIVGSLLLTGYIDVKLIKNTHIESRFEDTIKSIIESTIESSFLLSSLMCEILPSHLPLVASLPFIVFLLLMQCMYADRTWPVLILGSIMFIPGAYHVRLAYCAFKGYQGYSFDEIPEFE